MRSSDNGVNKCGHAFIELCICLLIVNRTAGEDAGVGKPLECVADYADASQQY